MVKRYGFVCSSWSLTVFCRNNAGQVIAEKKKDREEDRELNLLVEIAQKEQNGRLNAQQESAS